MFWTLIFACGLSGSIGVIARGIVRIFFLMGCAVASVAVIFLITMRITTPNVVTYHYDGVPFSQLSDDGDITARFHNTSDEMIKISSFQLSIDGCTKNGSCGTKAVSNVKNSGMRKDLYYANDVFIIPPHQKVDITFHYHFPSTEYNIHRHFINEKDIIDFSQEGKCATWIGCNDSHNTLI